MFGSAQPVGNTVSDVDCDREGWWVGDGGGADDRFEIDSSDGVLVAMSYERLGPL